MLRNSRLEPRTFAQRAVAGLAAMSIVGALSPLAAQSTYPPEVENYCKDDYFRYCSPYALGSDELRRCMEANGKTLSRNCQQALKDAGYVKADRLRKGS
jgi:hypothetical protein